MHDVFSVTKGPYYRLVGRYTQRFVDRAAKKTTNEMQKMVFFIAVAGVDDLFAKIFNVQDKSAKSFIKSTIEKRLKRQQVNTAFRIYLSTLLILLGNHKGCLLKETGLSETDWIKLWCSVFEYHSEDMEEFNRELLPAYQDKSFDALAKLATSLILEALSCTDSGLLFMNEFVLKDALINDMAAMLRILSLEKGA